MRVKEEKEDLLENKYTDKRFVTESDILRSLYYSIVCMKIGIIVYRVYLSVEISHFSRDSKIVAFEKREIRLKVKEGKEDLTFRE